LVYYIVYAYKNKTRGGLTVEKIKLNPNAFGFPMPVAILGTVWNGRPNFMALGWFNRVNHQPPMVGIGVHRSHVTYESIRDNGCFSLSFPSEDLMVETDYVGLVSGNKTDKSVVFPVFTGELENAPMVESCPITMECRVKETVNLPSNTLFVGEIVNAYSEERFMAGHNVDLARSKPIILSMLDNRFWRLGESIGKAWSIGRDYKK
jgi:flavin reductase (DIM6/NTAB) family NADH-FMN oxidoreductase RutF